MQIFKINSKISIVCEAKSTRYGFRHEATILYNGSEYDKTKICYQNRTWERYTYESVLNKVAEKAFSEKDKKAILRFTKKEEVRWN